MSGKLLIGQKLGRLTLLHVSKRGPIKKYLCKCDCGNKVEVQSGHLKSGHTSSCGCLRNEKTSARSLKHGYATKGSVSPEYPVWRAMKQRCLRPEDPAYKNYGGRGIKVCDRWKKFKNFIEDMGPRPTPKHTLERLDNEGDYATDNCRWVLRSEQSRNTRRNLLVTHQGKTQCLKDWAKEMGLSYSTVYSRYRRGWSPTRALEL